MNLYQDPRELPMDLGHSVNNLAGTPPLRRVLVSTSGADVTNEFGARP